MHKKTKIVATLGLVSDTKEILEKMIEAGMNVARLNFSHGGYDWHGKIIDDLRAIASEKKIAIGILADLQGPRIRTFVESPVEMQNGETILFSDVAYKNNIPSDEKAIILDVPNIVDDIELGNEILIEDGLMKVVVEKKENGVLETRVIDGGIVNNHKGVNIPDAKLKISPITEKDEKDLEFALAKGVDFVAMSFVSSGKNIEDLRAKMKKYLGREDNLPQIIAKIERKEAIKNLKEIIEHADCVMVARGDLGIEIEESRVAILQKEIIKISMDSMKPVIVATQMLNSMIENPRPTRAEVSDVTNAVVDHADAVMLSGESASGKYPVESVRMMAEIISNTEASPFDDITELLSLKGESDFKSLVKSAYELAKTSSAKFIMLASVSGFTARLMSHFRPAQSIFVITNNSLTYNQLSLVWGVTTYMTKEKELLKAITHLTDNMKEDGIVKSGENMVVILGSVPGGEKMQLVGVKTV